MAVLGAKQRVIPFQMSPRKSLQSIYYLPGLLSTRKKNLVHSLLQIQRAGGLKTKFSSEKKT